MTEPQKEKSKLFVKNAFFQKAFICFVFAVLGILFYFLLFKLDVVGGWLSKLFGIFEPIILGCVMAYLVNPTCNFFHRGICRLLSKKIKNLQKADKVSRAGSVFLSLLLFMLIIFILLYLVIPEVISSVYKLAKELPDQADKLITWVSGKLEEDGMLSTVLQSLLDTGKKWLQTDLSSTVSLWAGYFATGVLGAVNFLKNFTIGFMVAVYLLYNKRLFVAQSRKLLSAFLKNDILSDFLTIAGKSHKIFSGFINGKLIDSLIIGILCFIGVSLLDMPYIMLVSVIIGVTNIIPVFGPYIGAVPCALLILISNPLKGLYFIIFIILLQTLDGNIIGPKILGNSTGLSAFWVVFAITVFGGLFGIIGMMIGVPLFAVIYYIVSELVNNRLKQKKLPVSTDKYYTENYN